MSEDKDVAHALTNQPEMHEVFAKKMIDLDLFNLVKMANKFDLGQGVVLLVKGTLISGIIISGTEYYKTISSSFEDEHPLKQLFSSRAEEYSKYKELDLFDPASDVEYIHLKKFSVNQGGNGFNTYNSAVFRIKLEEIDGHIIGTASNA
ncbi:hypothetical protein Q7S_23176 (plasmid) [Rahnella aquatilis HX2]|nr:hypothetical protein Q7S_23176 [Rahnella aquatilis HX2]